MANFIVKPHGQLSVLMAGDQLLEVPGRDGLEALVC